MKTKKIFAAFALATLTVAGVFTVVQLTNRNKNEQFNIVTTNFVAYDFARAVIGDASAIKMLLKPATEMHNFEPTPQDIKDISNADFFIYTGGESDEWVSEILRDNNIDEKKAIRMMDFVELKEEELSEGMESEEESEEAEEGEEEPEYDEHIWTNPLNAIRIINALRDRFVAKNSVKLEEYTNNAEKYTDHLKELDGEIRDIVKNASRKELIFGDRFPFRYFVDEYGLDYYAAFPGCSDQTEASSNTVAFLIDKVKTDQIPVILKIELSSDKLAKTIADETGAKILTLNAAHNISQEDFEASKSYADIVKDNIVVLKEALN